MKDRQVGYIQNGIVIDHIESSMFYKAMKILRLDQRNPRVSMANRYDSTKMGEKGLIKIEGVDISEAELNLLSLIAPSSTISWIKDGKVKNQKRVHIPGVVEGIVDCTHASCVSKEPGVTSKLSYDAKRDRFECYYCGNYSDRNEIKVRI